MSDEETKIKRIQWITRWSIVINILLSLLKAGIGIVGKSQSLIADAIHSLTDLISDILIVMTVKLWQKPPDECHAYGHYRYETMVSVIIAVLLFLTGLGLGWKILHQMFQGKAIVPDMSTGVVAIISVLLKEWLYRWTRREGEKLGSSALIANAWHHRSDAFSSVPVAVSIFLIQLIPQWWFLDGVAAGIVLLFLFHAAWDLLSTAFHELTEGGVSHQVQSTIFELVSTHDQVDEVHKIRTRLVGGKIYVDMHLLVNATFSIEKGHRIADEVKAKIINHIPNVADVTIHIEPFPYSAKGKNV